MIKHTLVHIVVTLKACPEEAKCMRLDVRLPTTFILGLV